MPQREIRLLKKNKVRSKSSTMLIEATVSVQEAIRLLIYSQDCMAKSKMENADVLKEDIRQLNLKLYDIKDILMSSIRGSNFN